mgnify:FL=1
MNSRAYQILGSMTLDEKIGQLFIVRCPREGATEAVKKYHLGGFTLYAVDFGDDKTGQGKSPEEVRHDIDGYQAASELPMFIAVDEEGGNVVRASKFQSLRETPFESPAEVFSRGGLEALAADTKAKCRFLRSLGVNLNYAPVCDLSFDRTNYIYHRTFGQDAKTSADCAAAVVSMMKRMRMGCSLKHFPGYGDNVDTHTGIARDAKRTREEFGSSDYLPFLGGIGAGAGMVMVAHIIVDCMDGERPASLSPEVHRILREDMGFSGVIVTDSLDMGGITQFTGGSEAAVAALLAGNDLLCCSSYGSQIPAVRAAIADGTLTERRIDESVLRILDYKLSLGIIG